MGVQGLTSYVEGNRSFFQDLRFRDSRLVVDGCSLFFRLYFNHGLEQQHGGDYDTFASLLSEFLSALAACNIQPYVVLDGGMDPSNKKFATVRQRLQSKIKEADSLSHGRRASVLPLLTRDVFIQVLSQHGVPLVQCAVEADWEIACLANQWGCPILTNDSDFFIFDLPGGYLPFSFFHWTDLRGKSGNKYIHTRCYTVSGLCKRFGGMNRQLLPLCAVLAGNDYGTPRGTSTLLSMLDLTCPGRGGGGKSPPSRIEGLLLWLSSFPGPEEVLEEVGRMMGGGGEDSTLCSLLRAGMQDYHLTPQSSLVRWFSGGSMAPGGQVADPSPLPECLSWAAGRGALAPLVLDVLVLRRVMLIPQVENSRLPSSHCCALPIRQALYGILLHRERQENQEQGMGGRGQGGRGQGGSGQGGSGQGGSGQGGSVQDTPDQGKGGRGGRQRGRRGHGEGRGQESGGGAGSQLRPQGDSGLVGRGMVVMEQGETGVRGEGTSGAPLCVEEYDRHELTLRRNQTELHPPRTTLHLNTLNQAPLALRLGVLLDVLGVKESALTPVPPHLRLTAGVTAFWLKRARPAPSPPQLQALLLGMVYGELARSNPPGATRNQHTGPETDWAAERSVGAGLDRQRLRPGEKQNMDVAVAHGFSQWQACLWSALRLNQLLLLPLPEPYTAWLFSGSLVHGLVRSLRGGRTAESLLAGGHLSEELYRSMLAAVRDCSHKTHPSSSSSSARGRKRGKRGKQGRGGGIKVPSTREINNRFAMLMSEEDEDHDDEE